MIGRRVLVGGLLGGVWLLTGGHTPYKQWVVYRQRNLVVGSSRTDPRSYELAGQIAELLLRHLPASRARLGRSPTYPRLASLLATDQIGVAVVEAGQALAMAKGATPFEGIGAVPLRRLYDLGGHLLVSGGDFPDHHAWLVSGALDEHAGDALGGLPADAIALPVHPGTQAWIAGAPEPAPPLEAPAD